MLAYERRQTLKQRFLLTIVLSALLLFLGPPTRTVAQHVNYGSSMQASCFTDNCEWLSFVLDIEGETWVDHLYIFSRNASLWAFSDNIQVSDNSGTVLTSAYTRTFQQDDGNGLANEIVLRFDAAGSVAPEPLTLLVEMETQDVETSLGENIFTYGGDAISPTEAQGTEVKFYGTVTPEPITMILLGTGLIGIGGVARRKRRLSDDIATD